MRKPINDAQREALAWLAAGGTTSPPDPLMKLSVVALQNRGLAEIRRVRGIWSGSLTDDGRYFVEHGCYPPQPDPPTPVEARATTSRKVEGEPARSPRKARVPAPTPPEVDSPRRARARGGRPKGDPLFRPDEPDPWDERVMIAVKEAAWLLSMSEHEIRRAVMSGEVDRVFIGKGTTNYRVVYGSLLAWVNDLPRESSRWNRWW